MKRAFLDTNVVIDLLDKRERFYPAAVKLFTLAYKRELSLYLSPLTYATAAYVLRKHPIEELRILLSNLRKLSHVTLADEQSCWLTASNIPDRFDIIPPTSISLIQS